jgi:CheY-like chemotaxis protein
VALSGYALPDDLQRASEAGFERHLAKPPSLEQIAGACGFCLFEGSAKRETTTP